MVNGCQTGFRLFLITSVLWQMVNLETQRQLNMVKMTIPKIFRKYMVGHEICQKGFYSGLISTAFSNIICNFCLNEAYVSYITKSLVTMVTCMHVSYFPWLICQKLWKVLFLYSTLCTLSTPFTESLLLLWDCLFVCLLVCNFTPKLIEGITWKFCQRSVLAQLRSH